MSIESEFREKVSVSLNALTDDLTSVLKKLVEHDYPTEVDSLSFEVCHQSFTTGFPVRVFFMDDGYSEHFIITDGKPINPSPVDPGLLNIDYVYPLELEKEFERRDEDFDCWEIAVHELIEWFSICWLSAGGSAFKLKANIAPHDSIHEFDLMHREWQTL